MESGSPAEAVALNFAGGLLASMAMAVIAGIAGFFLADRRARKAALIQMQLSWLQIIHIHLVRIRSDLGKLKSDVIAAKHDSEIRKSLSAQLFRLNEGMEASIEVLASERLLATERIHQALNAMTGALKTVFRKDRSAATFEVDFDNAEQLVQKAIEEVRAEFPIVK